MFGLRQKLALGFGGLLVILLAVSGMGIAVLHQHRKALDRFLYENWRSVEYGQNMVDALARMEGAANQGKRDEAARDVFARNLEAEKRNVTLPGEDRLAGELDRLWGGTDGYLAA